MRHKYKTPPPEEILAASERTGIDAEQIADLAPYQICLVCAWRKEKTASELANDLGWKKPHMLAEMSVLRRIFPGKMGFDRPVSTAKKTRESRIDAQIERLIQLRAEGKNQIEIQEALGFSLFDWRIAFQIIKAKGLPCPKKLSRSALFLEKMKAGASVRDAAKESGLALEGALSRSR